MGGLAWVVGRGGLLGRSLLRALPEVMPEMAHWTPPISAAHLRWAEPSAIGEQLDLAAAAFARALNSGGHHQWTILWAAGAGVVGTSAAQLAQETETLSRFLSAIDAAQLPARRGRLFVASSAGGVHGGAPALPITEDSAPSPISDYGRAKLAQEALVARWAGGRQRVNVLLGRISNLYGPGQKLDKAQGFISQLCRNALLGAPVRVYVPLDTIRDFLFADDCARAIGRALGLVGREPAGSVRVKIFASEQAVSLGHVLALFARFARRPIKVVSARLPGSALQPAGLKFRSVVLPVPPAETGLLDGIARVWAGQAAMLREGRLALPRAEHPL
jgi:UDP-glucose 4-epimerase